MIRAALLACLLATPCAAELPTLANIEFVGGYRFPSWFGDISPTMAFANGGLAVATFGGEFHAWCSTDSRLGEASTSAAIGTGSNFDSWPLMDETALWSKSDIYGTRGDPSGNFINGMCYDHENSRLWVALRNEYWTTADPTQWVGIIDYPERTVNSTVPDFSGVLAMQMYGGGMTIIPADWATANTGGRRLGFASGGYKSGQGASQGPTFAASELTPTATPTAIEIMKFATTGQVGTDNDGTRNQVERSFPEYAKGDLAWSQAPDGDPLVGYWASSSVKGGGAWIRTGGFDALLHMSRQPTGTQSYALQSECFTVYAERANNLYVYDPDDLAEAAAGNIEPYEMRGTFYRWDESVNGGLNSTNYPARGLSFDPATGYLWVFYENAWGNGQSKNPVIAAYRFRAANRPQRLAIKSGSTLTLEVAE